MVYLTLLPMLIALLWYLNDEKKRREREETARRLRER